VSIRGTNFAFSSGMTYLGIPDCVLLTNGDVELIVTTKIGPRILAYRFAGGRNMFGEVPEAKIEHKDGTWRPYGGHRLWAAPEEMPTTYYPDNDPLEVESVGLHAISLRAPVEHTTKLQKEIRVTLAEHGSDVRVEHFIRNASDKEITLAPWALTIMRPGGTVIIPQEPYISHDDALLPARPMVLWHFTDLTDARWKIGKQLIELTTNSTMHEPQKIGVLNKQGWAACNEGGELFVKEFDYTAGADYPDYGSNCETYTAGDFLEFETLGPMTVLQPNETATHVEEWRLFKNVELPSDEKERIESLLTLINGNRV
jgi:hypothetical protein